MKKALSLLCTLALLLVGAAIAEETQYYTARDDPYYHLNDQCNRDFTNAIAPENAAREIIGGELYPLSQTAAELFGKIPCPLCTRVWTPVYSGKASFDLSDGARPWAPAWRADAQAKPAGADALAESRATNAAFDARYDGVGSAAGQADIYPEAYGGRYRNADGTTTYLVVNPTDELVKLFQDAYGGGVWLAAAKWSLNDMNTARDATLAAIEAWRKAHPDRDAIYYSAAVDETCNHVNIVVGGADFAELAAALPLPPCVLLLRGGTADMAYAASQ